MDYSNDDWTFTGVTWKNSSHPNSSRNEYGNNEKPGSAVHFHPSHVSAASLTSETPSFRPRGVLTFDLQHPFHHEPSFIAPPYQGHRPVGHPSPTSQLVSSQATFYPMMSGAPSILSPPYFCTPPQRHSGLSPAPFGHLPYDPRLFLSPMLSAGVDIQPVSVSMASPQSYVQPSHSALHPDGIGVSDVPLNVYPPKQSIPSSCPVCHKSFRRWQDRNRHLQSHLPYWIGCSFDGCSWRGYRIDIFRKHWHREHQPTSQPPDENGSKLYDPVPLVDRIVEGSVLIEDAENWAVERIKKIAVVLDKEVLLADPRGWKDKNLMDSRQYSHRRFAKMNAPSIHTRALSGPFNQAPGIGASAPVPRGLYTEAENGRLVYDSIT